MGQVRFSVRMEGKGPAADLVVKEGGMSMDAMRPMYQMPVYQQYPQMQQMQMIGSPKGAKGASKGAKGGKGFDLSATYFGTVIKFDDTKGIGFIGCDRIFKYAGKDVFLAAGMISGEMPVQAGSLVSFKVQM